MTDIGYRAIIAPEIGAFVEPIDGAKPHPDNVRKHRIEKIAQSLEAHGQRTPIVVQNSTGYIVKGNGTWEAARLLGWAEIAMIRQDMGDKEALEYLFADNRASDLSSYQREKLHATLSKLVGEGGLAGTLWEDEEFQDLEEEFSALVELPDTGMGSTQVAEEGTTSAPPQGAKMREVPLVLNSEDHAVFLEKIKRLQSSFGTSGSIATILEAVKRQADAEDGGVQTGTLITDEMRNEIVNETISDVLMVVATMPMMLTRQNVQEMLRKMLRNVTTQPMVEGQVAAFDAV
jgi:hypothetical protein